MRVWIAVSLAMVALIGSANAQVLYGSLVGNVADQSESAVAGAGVSVQNPSTNFTRAGFTDSTGAYSFPALPAGRYTVKISAAGFQDQITTGVSVTINSVARLDARLMVGRVQESVSVTADATALLQTERAEVRLELGSKALQSLPVAQGRNFQSLFKTLPGVALGRPPSNSASNPSQSYSFNVNGASASINNTRVDGASSTNIWLPHLNLAYVPALESLETVNVVTNSFDAEQGLAGGAAISVQIKSGTNQLHGSAFWYHDNSALRARNFFLPSNQGKSKLVYNQGGFTAGGPIKKDKLFYFTSYEKTTDRQAASLISSVPTAQARTGDFSGFAAVLYDPATGNPDGTGRAPFAQNRIPLARQDAISRKLIGFYPLPNQRGTGIGEINNFFVSHPFLFDRWTLDNKINWVVTSNVNVFGRYSVLDFRMDSPTAFGPDIEGPGLGGSRVGSPGVSTGKTHNVAVGGTWVITPTLLMDGNYGFVRQGTHADHTSIAKNGGLDLGIPGTNGPQPFQGGMPRFDTGNYAFLGVANHYMPYYRTDDQHQFVTNFTWTKKTHELRWGVDIYKQGMDHLQPEFVGGSDRGPRGRFNFGTGPTRLCTDGDGRGGCRTQAAAFDNELNSLGTMLLGLPTQLGKNQLTVAPYTTLNWQYSAFIRDRWQITRRLSFSYGTRWEYFPIPTRADRGLERYNPDTNKMEIGGVGEVPRNLGVSVSKGLFAPRAGLALRVTDRFVIRAGYGLTNDPYALARPLRTNHPVLIELDIRAPNSLAPAGRLADGIPAIPIPALGNGIIDIPGNVTAFTIPKQFDRGYIQSWNFTVERDLGANFKGEIGYVATRQTRQLGLRELNYANVNGGSAGQLLNQKFRRTANTQLVAPIGNSHFDSLQARLTRRFSGWYSLDAAYTWGKSISTSGRSNSDNTLAIPIPEFYALNRSISGFDRTHNLQITNIIEMPFGKGRRMLNNRGFATLLVSGWQISNVVSFMSGEPFSVGSSGSTLNAPGSTQRADQIKGEAAILGGIGAGRPWFDPTAFAAVNQARFGTAGFNSMRGPGVGNWDVGLHRTFRLTERVNLQFRAESFNFTNTPKFDNPRSTAGGSGFGEVFSAYSEREFRFGLRVGF
ncbi:MAG: TonB-dependent receptor [Candidatus Solibacter usitatus]|nr:TonB-dependent receptor [Candidatus Solibacter usitatus]